MFYTIQNNNLLIAENRQALERFYDKVLELPNDYEEGKYIVVDSELVLNPNWETEQAQKERELLNKLSMTRGDMFEAIILAFGKTKADIRSMIENVEGLTDVERALYLNRFDEALDFYRGYPAIDLIGKMLGVSSEQLDKFFKTKDYHELLPVEDNVIDNSITSQEEDNNTIMEGGEE